MHALILKENGQNVKKKHITHKLQCKRMIYFVYCTTVRPVLKINPTVIIIIKPINPQSFRKKIKQEYFNKRKPYLAVLRTASSL